MPAGIRASSASSTAAAGRSRARISSQSAPLARKLSEATRARSASTRAAWRRSDSRIGVVGGQAGDQVAGEGAQIIGRQGEPDVRALPDTVEQAAVAEKLEMAGQPRLGLPKDFGEFHHAEAAAGGEGEQTQPGRLGNGAQAGEEAFHGPYLT